MMERFQMLIFNWEGNLNTYKYLESLGIYTAFYKSKYVCFMQYIFYPFYFLVLSK